VGEEEKVKLNFPKVFLKRPIKDERIVQELFKTLYDNTSLLNVLSRGIFYHFISHQLLCTEEIINNFFLSSRLNFEVFCSDNRDIGIEHNAILFYPFGFEFFKEIFICLKRDRYEQEDTMAKDFGRVLIYSVIKNKFLNMKVVDSGVKFYNFDCANCESLQVQFMSNLKSYFILLLTNIFKHPSLFKQFNLYSFIQSKKNTAYYGKPFEIPEEHKQRNRIIKK
jgi:hypothetical protein